MGLGGAGSVKAAVSHLSEYLVSRMRLTLGAIPQAGAMESKEEEHV